MTTETYNALTLVLGCGAWAALALAAGFVVAAIVGWRGEFRNRRLLRGAASFGAALLLVGTHQFLLWKVYLPALGESARQQRKEVVDTHTRVRVGDEAPPLAVHDTEGRTFDLVEQRGKVVLLNFFATWCGPCLMELPHVQKLWDDNRHRGNFALIVIGRDETNEKVAAFRADREFTFAMAADPDQSIYAQYAEKFIPRTYLIGADGRVCYASSGFDEADLAELQKELARQLDAAP